MCRSRTSPVPSRTHCPRGKVKHCRAVGAEIRRSGAPTRLQQFPLGQEEYSLWCATRARDPADARELGIGFVPFSHRSVRVC